jgi:hypothetical protein
VSADRLNAVDLVPADEVDQDLHALVDVLEAGASLVRAVGVVGVLEVPRRPATTGAASKV